jgi:hypothetical protein
MTLLETKTGEHARSMPDVDVIESYSYCEYIDMTVTVIADPEEDEDAFPDEWTCPRCGGTRFDWMPTTASRD